MHELQDMRIRVGVAGAAICCNAFGLLIWPFLSGASLNPGTTDLIRLCGDVIGRNHITNLRVRISSFPPAIHCFPDGWQSDPVTATPEATTLLTVILIAFIGGIAAGATSLIRAIIAAGPRTTGTGTSPAHLD